MMQYENIDGFRWRTRSFMSDSLPKDGWLNISGGAKKKVTPEGRFRPFFGNTIIFEMNDEDKAWLGEIQQRLYDACGYCFAEPLQPDTFHITLHDLLNAPEERILQPAREMEIRALWKLEQIRSDYPEEIYVRPVFLFNMMNTSVVLGFEPASEEDCELLMRLYDEFQTDEFVPLNYPLTPHVTMAYYRPDGNAYDWHTIAALQGVFSEVSRTVSRRTVKLKLSALHHRYFIDMNHYLPEL